MAAKLPKLPGYNFDRPIGQARHHKPQGLGFSNGVVAVDLSKPGIGGGSGGGSGQCPASSAGAEGPEVPAWEAFDRQVLRFQAYFQEAVHERREEQHRVRIVNILFYLEDDTLQINEKAQKNSGIPQGTLLRRHRVPKPAPKDDECFSVNDFKLGREVTIYGRTYKLADCDEFTRSFLVKLGIRVGQPCEIPSDPYTKLRQREKEAMQPLKPYEKTDTLGQYLRHDREVLRFYCVWDDDVDGSVERRQMVVHFFLADSTVEVREVLGPNSGRDGPKVFLRRQKLPKDQRSLVTQLGGTTPRTVLNVFGKSTGANRHVLDNLQAGQGRKDHYTEADFEIGGYVVVFGRNLLIYDCDAYTRTFYKKNFGFEDMQPLALEQSSVEAPKMEVPPPTGFGNEDDSLVSVHRIVPVRTLKKMSQLELDNPESGEQTLRFLAVGSSKLDFHWMSGAPEDRTFVIVYYLTDNTIQVFERSSKSSGLPAGKFLERGAYKVADNSRSYRPTDFHIDASVVINKHHFQLFDADEHALSYMEDNNFPYTNVDEAVHAVLRAVEDGAFVAEQLRAADTRQSGVIPAKQYAQILGKACGDAVNKHQLITICRAHGDADGNVAYSDMANALAASA